METYTNKGKREKRFQQKKRYIERQMEICKVNGAEHLTKVPHKSHKKAAMNCGQPDCVMCGNPRKVWHQKTLKEKQFYCEPIEE